MKACPYCGRQNEETAGFCVGCGTGLPPQPPAADTPETELRLRDITADPVRRFRALVLVSTVAYGIYFFHLLLGGRLISREAWDLLAWDGYGALLPIPPAFSWLFLLLYLAVAVGLWMFSKSALLVFGALTAFFVIMAPLGGMQVQTAVGSFLVLVISLADGAILVMACTPPLREQFE